MRRPNMSVAEGACGAVNRLITACTDDMLAQEAAAGCFAQNTVDRDRLDSLVARRERYVWELTEVIRALGGSASGSGSSGSTWGRANAMLQGLRCKWGRSHRGDVLGTSARMEAATELAYVEALKVELPPHARLVIERQHGEVETDRLSLRRAFYLH